MQKETLTSRIEHIENLGEGRDDFERDYTAILYSHAFRRLRHKTQVFFYSQNDLVSTRLDHSLYVSSISEIVCKALNNKNVGFDLNPILSRAIGIGHDLGHSPFGHAGQDVLNKLAKDIDGFKHEIHSLRIVDKIEKPRERVPPIGLNLTLAVRDGIVNHCGESSDTTLRPSEAAHLGGNAIPCTYEGCIVRLVDKVAYLGRDLEDAITAGIIKKSDIPGEIAGKIGTKNGEIVDYFVGDLIRNSNLEAIGLSKAASSLMSKLYDFNYKNIYKNTQVKKFSETVTKILELLFENLLDKVKEFKDNITSYMENSNLMTLQLIGSFVSDRSGFYFNEEKTRLKDDDEKLYKRIVIDFMSTLTDHLVFQSIQDLYLPRPIV